MELAYAQTALSNMRLLELAPMTQRALVDAGALHLCIPDHVALQLDLTEIETREIILADGGGRRVAYVGPVRVKVANRQCLTGAMALGDEVPLGAIPKEDMDLVVRPSSRDVIPDPRNPNVAVSVAKGFLPQR